MEGNGPGGGGGWGAQQGFGKENIMKAFYEFLKFDHVIDPLLNTAEKRLELKDALVTGLGVWAWATTPEALIHWLDKYPGQLGQLLQQYRSYTVGDGILPHTEKNANALFHHGRQIGSLHIGDYKIGVPGRDDRHIARDFVRYIDKQIQRFVTSVEGRLHDFETTESPPPKKRTKIDIVNGQLALCNTTIDELKVIIETQANQIVVSDRLFHDRARAEQLTPAFLLAPQKTYGTIEAKAFSRRGE